MKILKSTKFFNRATSHKQGFAHRRGCHLGGSLNLCLGVMMLIMLSTLSCDAYGQYFTDGKKAVQPSLPLTLTSLPVGGSVISSLSKVDITYSKLVLGASSAGNYSLSGAGIGTLSIASATLLSGNAYRLTMSGASTSGDITISISNVADTSGNALSGNTITYKALQCPTNYIAVKANLAVSSTNDFCVAKYEMKNVGGVATSQVALTPWVSITQPSAITACSNLGAKYHLISNPEWMTIARDIEVTASNWSGGVVYNGTLNRGNSGATPNVALAASTDNDGCFGTGQTCSDIIWNSLRRTFVLSSSEIIWDLAGNVWELVNWQVPQVNKAYVSSDGSALSAYREFPVIDTYPNGVMVPNTWQPENANLDSSSGVGLYYAGTANPAVFMRGGRYADGPSAGIFDLSLQYGPAFIAGNIGFRCAYTP